MNRISLVVCVHQSLDEFRDIRLNLIGQSKKPFELIVLASEVDIPNLDLINFDGILYSQRRVENHDDWGHTKRAQGLMMARGDYVGFVNCDDEYDTEYVRRMSEAIEESGADIVACDWTERGKSIMKPKPTVNYITAGCYVVRRSLAQGVGYNHRAYNADGLFIEDLVKNNATYHRLDEALYHHR